MSSCARRWSRKHSRHSQAVTSLVFFPNRLIFSVLLREKGALISLECAFSRSLTVKCLHISGTLIFSSLMQSLFFSLSDQIDSISAPATARDLINPHRRRTWACSWSVDDRQTLDNYPMVPFNGHLTPADGHSPARVFDERASPSRADAVPWICMAPRISSSPTNKWRKPDSTMETTERLTHMGRWTRYYEKPCLRRESLKVRLRTPDPLRKGPVGVLRLSLRRYHGSSSVNARVD